MAGTDRQRKQFAATMMWQLETDMNNNNLALKSGEHLTSTSPVDTDACHSRVQWNYHTIYRNEVSSSAERLQVPDRCPGSPWRFLHGYCYGCILHFSTRADDGIFITTL
jgi:hypothetical protein